MRAYVMTRILPACLSRQGFENNIVSLQNDSTALPRQLKCLVPSLTSNANKGVVTLFFLFNTKEAIIITEKNSEP